MTRLCATGCGRSLYGYSKKTTQCKPCRLKKYFKPLPRSSVLCPGCSFYFDKNMGVCPQVGCGRPYNELESLKASLKQSKPYLSYLPEKERLQAEKRGKDGLLLRNDWQATIQKINDMSKKKQWGKHQRHLFKKKPS